ncbi:prephenate dehydrogenase [Heliophilum fasciatum]|uniref:Prephenate dehydrogenase n=1 Tax=Heliophilum fasciatum TaxID=35700 RepID=A0A4R2RV63_9FIRM|nr:prephenate dehydrogenase [Heliophilum fasciatum]MCW2278305.1 prephenate dehydrogenase [Heliophilum fasciatum]TCP63821.1 prephenate dehydrogenase [Heliophilum fasciatum]
MMDGFGERSLFRRVAIIGLGVIGGSLGMALTQGRVVEEVVGFDRDPATLEVALATHTVHRIATDPVEAVRGAQVVVLATPVSLYPALLAQIGPALAPGTIVTDVGSTKRWVVETMSSQLPTGCFFVGGHPMAGSEKRGIEGADRYLLENAVYVLTPDEHTDPEALAQIEGLVMAIGARVVCLAPAEHDHVVALVSHLPHMVAVALMETLGASGEHRSMATMLAAGGFRDTTRIAAGDPRMWCDIAWTNREALLAVIDQYQASLARIAEAIRTYDPKREGEAATEAAADGALPGVGVGSGSLGEPCRGGSGSSSELSTTNKLSAVLAHARQARLAIPGRAKGVLPGIHEVIVTVADEPGIIGKIAQILGAQAINIADIEILRVREGHGGTIRLGFAHGHEADLAVDYLRDAGIIVKRI